MLTKNLFKINILDSADSDIHFHQDIELLFVLEGTADVNVEEKISHLKREDVFVINANKKHSYKVSSDALYMILMINYQMVSEAFQNNVVFFSCDSSVSQNERYTELKRLICQLLNQYVEQNEHMITFGYLSDCYAVLNTLIANFMMKTTEPNNAGDTERYQERLYQINNYISMNYDHDISMKELSEKLFLSNGYLSRFFKKNYGMNFAGYLSNVRVFHSAEDLLYTDAPITRIAFSNGFSSAALYNKAFKKVYGQTPTEFRKKTKPPVGSDKDKLHETEIGKRLGKVIAPKMEKEAGENLSVRHSELQVNIDEKEPLERYWGNLINLGDASYLLHSSMKEQLMFLNQALGFRYVRFSGIFSQNFYIRPDQQNDFEFSQIDALLDSILEQDMKPHIELGLKPITLHHEIGATETSYSYRMDQVTDEQWERLMRSLMRHLSIRYGQDELDEWIFELWLDEDWRVTGNKYMRYFDLFDITWKIIKECNDKIKLGGYGIRMDAGLSRRFEFLKKWSGRPCHPDFISVMYYAYERGEDELDKYAKRLTDNEAFLHFVTREEDMIKRAGLGDIPVWITEWNITPSVRNFINDTPFKGAYIIKNVIDLYGKTSNMGYGAGSDREYSSYDTPDLLYGGTGLLTKNGIFKPAAFAFDFLNHLYPYCIGRNKNCMATTDGHDNFGIVCHNQQTLNYNYYLTPETEIDKSETWKYFEGNSRLIISIRLQGVCDGIYRVKVYRISEQNGSILSAWKDMGYERELSRNDIKYFRRVCEPHLTMRKCEVKNGMLLFEDELMPNEISFIRIHRAQ